jgi:hypothetical protein
MNSYSQKFRAKKQRKVEHNISCVTAFDTTRQVTLFMGIDDRELFVKLTPEEARKLAEKLLEAANSAQDYDNWLKGEVEKLQGESA